MAQTPITGYRPIKYGKNVRRILDTENTSGESGIGSTPDFSQAADLKVIEDDACYRSSFTDTDIIIPRGVKEIGDAAFHGSNITSVDIPDGCQVIGVGAFESCTSLETAKIPSVILTVPSSCFSSTLVHPGLTIHDNIRTIEAYAFYGNLKSSNMTIVMPSKLESIGANAFSMSSSNYSITYDFTKCGQVPTITSTSLGNINKIIVSPAMYGAFGTASVWSDIADKLEIGETTTNN